MSLAGGYEPNDCTVRAVAVACRVPYHKALAKATELGRRPNRRWCVTGMMALARSFGYELQPVSAPAVKTMVTFGRWVQQKKGGYIALVRGHVAGAYNGQVTDWAEERRFRIICLWQAKRR